jgi:hypothetical protein
MGNRAPTRASYSSSCNSQYNNDDDDDDDDNIKYKDLTIEIQRMWNVKARVIPVTIGATGTISKSFRKYVSNITGNHDVGELQKTAI